MHLGSILTNTAQKYPNRTALVHLKSRWTYETFNRRVNRLSDALLNMGVKKGDGIALLFYNSNHFVEAYFAAVKIGAVAIPVNFRFIGPEIEYIINDSSATIFFYGKEFQEIVSECRPLLNNVTRYITVDSPDTSLAADYERLMQGGEDAEPNTSVGPGDVCQIMYTSGTTGKPKGAVITHQAVIWNMINTLLGREDREGETALIIGPLYHTAALNNHLTIQVALGGTSILIKRFDPADVLEVIEKERATTISGSPTMYQMLLQSPDAKRFDLSSITKCTVGSAILPVETKLRLQTLFPGVTGIYDVYGCTEAAPSISILREADSRRKPGSVGRALPFVQVRIVDETDSPLPSGAVGELVCRGPNLMTEYCGQPEATREALRGGWFHTGDMAQMDDEGFIYIVDRKKDMINSGGENISPREVEEVLHTHPLINDAAVVGVADPLWGEAVRAFVVVQKGAELTESDVIEHCKRHLASYKKPKHVTFIDEIPKNPSGKILKTKLRCMPL
ncbi:MAG: long-chain fatty acid--CoA ligase [Deltaproteobacteria bacterium]|nr:long-chain fatty acid--CoA ligase [Deltaproteobacteria bacterium]